MGNTISATTHTPMHTSTHTPTHTSLTQLSLPLKEHYNDTTDTTPTYTAANANTANTNTTSAASITDIKSAIDNDLITFLTDFVSLDVPMKINDKGRMCQQWSNYDNGQYSQYGSKCAPINQSDPSAYYCVDTDSSLVSCNKLITPSVLENMKIDIHALLTNNGDAFTSQLNNYFNTVRDLESVLLDGISAIKSKGLITNEQNYFFSNNENNIIAKNTLSDKYKAISDDKTNNVNIERENITIARKQLQKQIKNEQIFKNAIYVLIALIGICIVLNIMFSRTRGSYTTRI